MEEKNPIIEKLVKKLEFLKERRKIVYKQNFNKKSIKYSSIKRKKNQYIQDKITQFEKILKIEQLKNSLIEHDFEIIQKINQDKRYNRIEQKEGNQDREGFVIKEKRVSELNIHFSQGDSDLDKSLIYEFNGLKILILRDFTMEKIHPNIQKLKKIKNLKISGNINQLSEEIINLPELENLDLEYNKIENLPPNFSNLKSLKFLCLANNNIKIIPEDFGKLFNLKVLNLENNQIESLPSTFYELKSLEKLNLRRNRVKFLNKGWKNLRSLKQLDLSNNLIELLSDDFGNIENLEILNLQNNHISILPKLSFPKLNSCNIINNHLKFIPETIGNLKNLKILKLRKNQILTIPESIGDCISLIELDISENNINYLPESFGNLKKLEELDVSGNLLLELPKSFENLESLERLSFNNNPKIRFPEYFFEDYYYNKFPEIVRELPPSLLLTSNPNQFRSVNKIFSNSINKLENLKEFKKEFLGGLVELEPYILRLIEERPEEFSEIYKREGELTEIEEKYKNLIKRGKEIKEKRDLKILFVELVESIGSRSYPMGILLLSGYLKKYNFSNIHYLPYTCRKRFKTQEQDLYINYNDNSSNPQKIKREFIDNIITINPHLIFVGPVVTPNLIELPELILNLRERFPTIPIFAGGPHFGKNESMDNQFLKICSNLDGIIIGEAEKPILEISQLYYDLWKKESYIPNRFEIEQLLLNISGLKTKTLNFKTSESIDILDIPPPDYNLLWNYWKKINFGSFPRKLPKYKLCDRRNPYLGEQGYVVDDAYGGGSGSDSVYYFDVYNHRINESPFPFAIVVGSRNCPYNCSFCCSHGERKVHSAEYIFNQMIDNFKYFNTNLFVFFDPLFTTAIDLEQKRIDTLCNMLINSNQEFQYLIEIRADVILKLPEQLLKKIILSGCIEFNMGLEKGSNQKLAKIMKKVTIQDHKDAIKKIRELSKESGKRVLINGTFIFGGPEETRSDIIDTLLHGLLLDLDNIIFFSLEIHPGTQIFQDALKEGLITENIDAYMDSKKYPLYITEEVSYLFLEKLKDELENLLEAEKRLNSILYDQDLNSSYEWRTKMNTFLEPILKKVIIGEYSDIIVEKEKKFTGFENMDESIRNRFRITQKDFCEAYNHKFDSILGSIEKEVVFKYKDDNFDKNYDFSLKRNLVEYISNFYHVIQIIKNHK